MALFKMMEPKRDKITKSQGNQMGTKSLGNLGVDKLHPNQETRVCGAKKNLKVVNSTFL